MDDEPCVSVPSSALTGAQDKISTAVQMQYAAAQNQERKRPKKKADRRARESATDGDDGDTEDNVENHHTIGRIPVSTEVPATSSATIFQPQTAFFVPYHKTFLYTLWLSYMRHPCTW